jgi:putative transposase
MFAFVDIWRHVWPVEAICRMKWLTRRQAETLIFQYNNGFYNSRRRQSYLCGISPPAFEANLA